MTRRTALQAALFPAFHQALPLRAFDAAEAIKALFKRTEPVTWVFTGDSITHGASHTMGARSYSEHFAERLRWEMRRTRDIVINTGISGNRLHKMLEEVDWRVLRFNPDAVSIMFGMNDCLAGPAGHSLFRSSLQACFEKVQAKGAQLLLHTPNLIHYPADQPRKDLPAYVEIIRAFAAGKKLPLVDHYAHWTATRQTPYSLLVLLADGAIHPNQFGHIELARETMRVLGIDDPNSRTGRLFVP